MDPLAITTGVITTSIKALRAVQSLAAKYKVAELSISATRSECSAVNLAFLQIQKLLVRAKQNDHAGHFNEDLSNEYETVVADCSATFMMLNESLAELGSGALG